MINLNSVKKSTYDISSSLYNYLELDLYRWIDEGGDGHICNTVIIHNLHPTENLFIGDIKPHGNTYNNSWIKHIISGKQEKQMYFHDSSKIYIKNESGYTIKFDIIMAYDNTLNINSGVNINWINDNMVLKPVTFWSSQFVNISTAYYSYSIELTYDCRKLIFCSYLNRSEDVFGVSSAYSLDVVQRCDKPIVLDNIFFKAGSSFYIWGERVGDSININEFSGTDLY